MAKNKNWKQRHQVQNTAGKMLASQVLKDLYLRNKISTFVGMVGWLAFFVTAAFLMWGHA